MNNRFFVICCLIVMKVIHSPSLANDCGTDQQLQHIAQDFMPPPKKIPSSKRKVLQEKDDKEQKSIREQDEQFNNGDIKKKLEKTYEENLKEIVSLHNHVGFGILIAIFYMNADFRVRKKTLIAIILLLSIFSILSNYLACNYLAQESLDLLQEVNQKPLSLDYNKLFTKHEFYLCAVKLFLVLAALGFSFLGYQFLFDKKNQLKDNKPR